MNESRKQFEEWVKGFYGWDSAVVRSLGDTSRYDIDEVHNYWRAWQASRKVLEDNQ